MSISQRSSRGATQGTLLATAALLFFIDLFLPWSQACSFFNPLTRLPGATPGFHFHAYGSVCLAQSGGWGGAGTVAGVLAGLLFLWEAARVARLGLGLGIGYRSLISAAFAFGVLIFTIIDVVARLTWGAQIGGSFVYGGVFVWIALGLAILIGLGGVVHWRIWDVNGPVSVADPESSAPVEVPPKPAGVCPNCGHVNSDDARFCSACGTSLGQPTPRRRTTRRPPPAS
jgi:hypothetical protein